MYSSNWTGDNANTRLMNILTPKWPWISDPNSEYQKRASFLYTRSQTLHNSNNINDKFFVNLILCNQGDGEGSGYSIYGNDKKPLSVPVDEAVVTEMRKKNKRFSRS